jgi:hypothetical protein
MPCIGEIGGVINVDQRDLWENDNVKGQSEVEMAKEVPEVLRLSVDLGIDANIRSGVDQ